MCEEGHALDLLQGYVRGDLEGQEQHTVVPLSASLCENHTAGELPRGQFGALRDISAALSLGFCRPGAAHRELGKDELW